MNETGNGVSFEEFREQWLVDVRTGSPSTVQLGNRFAAKIVTQWCDVDEGVDELHFCDGSGDGGIDVAFLDKQDGSDNEDAASESTENLEQHTWYLVQSKYGKAFSGTGTLLEEGQKVIDTLDGNRERLSSLAKDILDMISNFRGQASENDRIVLVFATEIPLTENERRVLTDLRAMGKERIGAMFDVDSISIETIYKRTLEEAIPDRTRVTIKAELVPYGGDLLLGSTTLFELYALLKSYREETNDLDQLYEKNIRRFLGIRRKVNRAIQATLQDNPERFGLFNNGITIVVEDFRDQGDGSYELVEPFIVNGCQTTRTIWEVFYKKLESGGTGTSAELDAWSEKAAKGVVVTKIARVGSQGEDLLQQITRHTNTQNA
ncbi:MAG: AIPR family protein, partial [candidate division Zixibacteria bacterium]|nr:AIPR family protein [candidate division Zixibacteria bacterium]